jgi:hypothetical protein
VVEGAHLGGIVHLCAWCCAFLSRQLLAIVISSDFPALGRSFDDRVYQCSSFIPYDAPYNSDISPLSL